MVKKIKNKEIKNTEIKVEEIKKTTIQFKHPNKEWKTLYNFRDNEKKAKETLLWNIENAKRLNSNTEFRLI